MRSYLLRRKSDIEPKTLPLTTDDLASNKTGD
jgi:hypothetical protein